MQQNEIKQERARITATKLTGRKGQQQRKNLGFLIFITAHQHLKMTKTN